MKIPAILEHVLLENRKELNAVARKMNSARGKKVMSLSPDELNEEIRFWEIENDEKMENFILTELYDALFTINHYDKWEYRRNELSVGYGPLFEVMDFERGFQSEGWYFVDNIGLDAFKLVIQAQRFFKNDTEADALSAVSKQYVTLDEMDDHDTVLSAAYHTVENHLSDFDDQLSEICKFIRSKDTRVG